jgi:hypothetical protein
MNSFHKRIEEATADAGPDIAAAFERLEIARAEADKEAASRAADIGAAGTGVAPSCSIDEKGQPTFVNFDPYADFAATIALLQKEKALLERRPGTKNRAKQLRTLESLITRFSVTPAAVSKPTNRKEKRMAKKLRRKAARGEQLRK